MAWDENDGRERAMCVYDFVSSWKDGKQWGACAKEWYVCVTCLEKVCETRIWFF